MTSKHDRLKQQWRRFFKLLNKDTGFGWDINSGKITGGDEFGPSGSRELTTIFNGTTATGCGARASTQTPDGNGSRRRTNLATCSNYLFPNESNDEEMNTQDSDRTIRRRRGTNSTFDTTMNSITEASRIIQYNVRPSTEKDQESLQQALKALESLPNVPMEVRKLAWKRFRDPWSLMSHMDDNQDYDNVEHGDAFQSNTPMRRIPYRQTTYTGADWINELLSGHDRRFYDAMGMNKKVFKLLCQEIKQTGCHGDERQQKVRIQESVAVFLHTIKGHQRHRRAVESFNRSTETISNHDCIGAIDGTIIPAWIPEEDHGKYRCRKGYLSQNVMVACDFECKFTFVLAGWEGSANDARIFAETLTDPTNTFPWPPEGKYYVVDSGYANIPRFLSPYLGDRYHLPEWIRSNQTPQNARELFNRRHATVWNVVERSFGILKGKFPIIKGLMPNYPPEFQTDIVIACCVAHNFILEHQKIANVPPAMQDPDYIPEPDEDDFTRPLRTMLDTSNVGLREQSGLRDSIADALWRDHGGRHR
ncbi:Unknown protein [Striga hermonthica]|uniref:DDE Tnp4 domain-containing protein n=1 Tax=Striga hermonthica TaxID=68872 RepID=A0A9N7QZC1_STRHE|nr:Unknown protein [Striga hermonthica]